MTGWTPTELDRIGRADELEIASRRNDGTLRPFVPIWMVTHGGDLYVRSAVQPNGWYRNALASGVGRVRAGGVERDATFIPADDAAHSAIDAAYARKYGRYGQRLVDNVTGETIHPLTLRIDVND